MKKNGIEVFEGVQRLKKMRFILKRSLLFLFVSVFFLQAEAASQVVRLTLNLKEFSCCFFVFYSCAQLQDMRRMR